LAVSIQPAASLAGYAVIIACTLVMPNDAASAAKAWNAFTCAARSGIFVSADAARSRRIRARGR
jgi:hypothetical protein